MFRPILTYRSSVKRRPEGVLKHPFLIPGGPYKECWDWDSFFTGIALIKSDRKDAEYLRGSCLNFLDFTEENGRTPGVITPNGVDAERRVDVAKPFLAQGLHLSSEALSDYSWLSDYYPRLRKFVLYREQYLMDKRTKLMKWTNSMESGMDNNVAALCLAFPRSIIGVDLNSYLYLEYKAMENIARNVSSEEEQLFGHKALSLKESMATFLWNDQKGSYFNIFSVWDRIHELIERNSCSNFIPLWASVPTQEQAKAMIEKYLLNEQEMLSRHGIRSLSRRDLQYNQLNIIKPYSNWQGPIFINVNFMIVTGLKNYGYIEEAKQIWKKVTNLCLNDISTNQSMHENYDADTGEPLAAPNFVSWNLLCGIEFSELQLNTSKD